MPLVKLCRHHPALLVELQCTPQPFMDVSNEFFPDFRNGNYADMNAFLHTVDWASLMTNETDYAAEAFSEVLVSAISAFVPIKQRLIQQHPPWSNQHLKSLKTAKRAALTKYSKRPTRRRKARYRDANRKYHRLNKRRFNAHIRYTQRKLKSNPKQFWSYVNQQRNESGLPTTMTQGDIETSSPIEICNLFRDQFSSVFMNEQLTESQVQEAASSVPIRAPIGAHPTVDAEDIRRACSKMKNSICSGPDGVPAFVLKKCVESLACPLAHIFNLSLRSGIFPTCWKQSFIFPVHKKGCKRNIRNYRGIAALCAVSKLFEVVVLDFLRFNTNSYIAPEQHGFVPKRSTSSNLVTYTSSIIRAMQQGHQVDAVYTDLSAAFDKINHRIAIAKLSRLGFNGPFLQWLLSYLTGRVMCVKLGDIRSAPFIVFSGVPQGSHLGPLIYLLYMNDVHLMLRCDKLSYADDIKLFTIVHDDTDFVALQNQLDVFAYWCSVNRMLLNASKCSVITFSRKRSPVLFNYSLNNTTLTRTSTVNDLGVLLDTKLTFTDHLSYITSKASRSLGFIFRIAKCFSDISCLKALYCALVRSTIEYCSVVWAPFYQNGIERVESVQRKFTRFALRRSPRPDGRNPPDYSERCEMLQLNSLRVRRDTAKALFAADLILSNVDSPELLQQLNFNIRNRALRSHDFLRTPGARTNYGHNEPVSSMCRAFNLCSDVFDLHLSRTALKRIFTRQLVDLSTQARLGR